MTYEVQQTRWDRIIRRVSGSIGPGSRVSETISELFPMIDVERVPSELLLLGGTQVCFGQIIVNGTAANTSKAMVVNPAGSNTLITITQLSIFSTTAQIARMGVTLNAFGTPGTQTIRDTRRGPAGVPVGQVLGESSLGASTLFFRFQLNGTDTLFIKDPNDLAVLAPGTAFDCGVETINTNLRVGFMWRERPAEPSELQF